MGHHSALGIDFGTSNSTVAVAESGAPKLLPIEGTQTSIPSTVFFNFETHEREYGRQAIQSYVDDHEGRFMRALKSILGSSLMDEHTYIRGVRTTYTGIISGFAKSLKERAEHLTGRPHESLVAGRPVHFVDAHPEADAAAERALEAIYRDAGFTEVVFQYEPIAAALDYERQVNAEELVLVADLGGGTSDFSIVRVSPEGAAKADRSADILATSGVHIGGTDLDRLISVDRVMPLLGLGSSLRRDFARGTLTIPRHLFLALSTWQEIHRLYDQAILREVADYRRQSTSPHLIDRLKTVLVERLGHRLLLAIEDAKITLTDHPESVIALGEIERGLSAALTAGEFNALIEASAQKIRAALERSIADAAIARENIAAVFFTGGTAAIPSVRRTLTAALPAARTIDGDRFGSVGIGLALDAQRLL